MLVTFNSRSQNGNKVRDVSLSNPSNEALKVKQEKDISSNGTGNIFESSVPIAQSKPTNEPGSVKMIKNSTDFHKFKESGRSRYGCITCKIRKKKCDETRPVCSDCSRLSKKCYYVDRDTMTNEEIQSLKKKVEIEESNHKLRKRKLKPNQVQASADEQQKSRNKNKKRKKKEKENVASMQQEIEPFPSKISTFSSTSSSSTTTTASCPKVDSPITTSNIKETLSETKEPVTPQFESADGILVPSKSMVSSHSIESLSSFAFDHDSASPSTFLNLLKEMSRGHDYITQANKIEEQPDDHLELASFMHLPTFNGIIADSFDQDVTTSTTTTTTTTTITTNNHSNGASTSYLDLISSINAHLTPSPQPPLYIPELVNPSYSFLYNYYVDVITNKISIAPVSQDEANSYQKIFLPLAHKDKGVFYSLLAWAGYQLGGTWEEEAQNFVKKALVHFHSKGDEDRQSVITKLALILTLCAAEICNGDVKKWGVYLNWGWKLLESHGGIAEFNKSKEEHWLTTIFAYHDLLASPAVQRGTYYSPLIYDRIFDDSEGFMKGQLHPLIGVAKRLFRLIGDISDLLYKSRKLLKEYYERGTNDDTSDTCMEAKDDGFLDSDLDFSDTESEISQYGKSAKLLSYVITKANELEQQIDESKPDKKDLYNLSDHDLELQLTLFEAFQLSAKLFLRQSVLKCNPSHLESQVMNINLIKCLDILIGSPVQASLVFPTFIAGIHCVSKHDQQAMQERVKVFIKTYGMFNVNRVKDIMEKIWKKNSNGNQVLDWHEILDELGWDLNFA
ncbi:hypothetical protein KGF56_000244 [Candida oxycetoniae]|uniref:Zn(2)-C6 fungal-type domain-containing protein n=1 Tax=Candida oxycetoniae TaxID=497107 RepID=A0AAI9T153_9ASCO|nr:uncharacterized protein KGF56_000244 [Candida oxycetoniae]KAI3406951.2 hypothetical protein KGF56_000244 [Candida oxycetoniae]